MSTKLYTIGQVSKIMGISVQSLRAYCDLGVIKPEYINPETGYRHFSYKQFPFIDRTRYLLKCGLELQEIREILEKDDINLLLKCLDAKETKVQRELEHARHTLNTIQWYRDYFAYEEKGVVSDQAYTIKHIPKRYLLAVPCLPEDTYEDFHIRLLETKNSQQHKSVRYKRQLSLIVDYDSMLNNVLERKYLGINVWDIGECQSEHVFEIPEGEYFCFSARVCSDDWNAYLMRWFFEGKKKPQLILANEFENSFWEYSQCLFEVQALIEP